MDGELKVNVGKFRKKATITEENSHYVARVNVPSRGMALRKEINESDSRNLLGNWISVTDLTIWLFRVCLRSYLMS